MLTEGKAQLDINQEKVSKKAEVFYNPVMKFNRDVTLLLLDSVSDKQMQATLPLCASGVRGIRMLKELKESKIKSISFNDYNENVVNNLRKNLILNQLDNLIDNSEDNIITLKNNLTIKSDYLSDKNSLIKNSDKKRNLPKIQIFNKDANQFLSESHGFDYIDLDPFGTPNPFLDMSIKRLSRGGILAVTATDTSGLTGTYLKVTRRRYWSIPLHNELMHEVGIRILIYKIQLIGAQYDKALTPIYCYSKDHYYRVFFRCLKGKSRVDSIVKEHKYLLYDKSHLNWETLPLQSLIYINANNPKENNTKVEYSQKKISDVCGPLWCGKLWDKKLAEKIAKNKLNLELSNVEKTILEQIKEESNIEEFGFLDMHKFGKVYKKNLKISDVLDLLKKNNINASRTHFTPYGIRGVSGETLCNFV